MGNAITLGVPYQAAARTAHVAVQLLLDDKIAK